MTDQTTTTTHLYRADRADDWTTVRLLCPWDEGSDMIPPPAITFGSAVFRYAGTEHDDDTTPTPPDAERTT